MSINNMQIGYSIETTHPHGWHRLNEWSYAMNINGGVLVKTDSKGGTSTVLMPERIVAQRWLIEVVASDADKGTSERILVMREVDIIESWRSPDPRVKDVFVGGHPRWFHADEPMPMPTDDQIRDYAAGLTPDDTITALTREVLRLHQRLADAERGDEHQRLADAVSDYLEAMGVLDEPRVFDLPTEMQRLTADALAARGES